MKLTTRSRYGTRMLLDIALYGEEHPVRIADIASRQKISVKYLEKLIRELRRGGFIVSRRGPKGGHMLKVPASEIRMGDVVRVLEGEEALVGCAADERGCARAGQCPTRILWRNAIEAVYDRLNGVTLADLMREDQCNLMPFDPGFHTPRD